ncbi:MAG: ankyrin repeat domain-containing protein [Alphaproteobacteria bacterium]|nr:ankyrin repeat domain-containing protein [Alphaproteobacteria bacterium]
MTSYWQKRSWFKAVKAKDIKTMAALLQEGCDINCTDNKGRGALYHSAFRTSNYGLTQWLIDRGAKPDAGESPLFALARSIQCQDPRYPNTAWSYYRVCIDEFKELHGIYKWDINAQDQNGDTVMHVLLRRELFPVAEDIFSRFKSDIDPTIKNNQGMTILDVAIVEGAPNCDKIRGLVQTYEPQEEPKNDVPVPPQLKISQEDAVVEEKPEKQEKKKKGSFWAMFGLGATAPDAPPSAPDPRKLWFKAVKENDLVALEDLIGQGADVDIQDEDGCTAIYHALKNDNIGFACWLRDKGANPNIGKPPLIGWLETVEYQDPRYQHSAAAYYDKKAPRLDEVCQSLALDMNAQDKNGDTFLHCLYDKKFWYVGEYVRKRYGDYIDPTVKNDKGMTVLDVAAQRGASNYKGLKSWVDSYRKKSGIKTEAKVVVPQVRSQMKKVQKRADGWMKTDRSEVARVVVKQRIGYTVTEVFNFAAGTYTNITQNMATRAESQAILPLAEFQDRKLIKSAENALCEQGGYVPERPQPQASPVRIKKRVLLKPGGAG